MLLHLLKASCVVIEAPTDEVETTAKLTSELLRTLHVSNLLEELVSGVEVRKLEVCQFSTITYFIYPVDSLLSRTVYLVLTLSCEEENVGITEHTEVDSTLQSSHYLVVDASTDIGVFSYWQSAIVVIGAEILRISNLCAVSCVAKLIAFPVVFVSADGPIEAWVELAGSGALCLKEVIEPRRSREVSPSTE